MTGDDLIKLAGLLVEQRTGNEEARFRSAVSRAYYGAFHFALATLKELGAEVLSNAEAHQSIYRQLFQTQQENAVLAARLLNDLRGDRNEADYRLHKKRFTNKRNVKTCVETAIDVHSQLTACLEEPTRSNLSQHFKTS